MRGAAVHLIVCALAAAAGVAPALSTSAPAPAATSSAFPGWPATFEGRALAALPPTELDARFAAGDGVAVRRFRDGPREVVVRWSAAPSRHLHPASVCFRALGWSVEPAPLSVDADGRAWSRFVAVRGDARLSVKERVEDATGRSFAEPTEWYWASLLGDTSGPAFAFTVAEPE